MQIGLRRVLGFTPLQGFTPFQIGEWEWSTPFLERFMECEWILFILVATQPLLLFQILEILQDYLSILSDKNFKWQLLLQWN